MRQFMLKKNLKYLCLKANKQFILNNKQMHYEYEATSIHSEM